MHTKNSTLSFSAQVPQSLCIPKDKGTFFDRQWFMVQLTLILLVLTKYNSSRISVSQNFSIHNWWLKLWKLMCSDWTQDVVQYLKGNKVFKCIIWIFWSTIYEHFEYCLASFFKVFKQNLAESPSAFVLTPSWYQISLIWEWSLLTYISVAYTSFPLHTELCFEGIGVNCSLGKCTSDIYLYIISLFFHRSEDL